MNDRTLIALARADIPVLAPGHVWLAGAGPGDPGLLTLDALAGLSQADVIVHDALVGSRVLALAGPQARLEFAGKRGGRPSAQQADISTRLIELARAGNRVLRLKGGDPCVFGRGGEEALALARAGVPYRLIPGVTAGLAGLTAAAIPATFRGINRAFILAAGYGADDDRFDWTALARTGQPIVLYMAMRNLDKIADELMRGGLPPTTPAAVVVGGNHGRRARGRIHARPGRGRCAGASAGTPSIVVIGEIVRLRERLLGERSPGGKRAGSMTARGLIIAAPSSGAGQDDHDARHSCGVQAQRRRGARRESGPRLHRPGVSRRRHRNAQGSISTPGRCRHRSSTR